MIQRRSAALTWISSFAVASGPGSSVGKTWDLFSALPGLAVRVPPSLPHLIFVCYISIIAVIISTVPLCKNPQNLYEISRAKINKCINNK